MKSSHHHSFYVHVDLFIHVSGRGVCFSLLFCWRNRALDGMGWL